MPLAAVFDDHVLQRYRALLDAEDAAFDALEHACEDGDRTRWEADVVAWQEAVTKKVAYLQHLGFTLEDQPAT